MIFSISAALTAGDNTPSDASVPTSIKNFSNPAGVTQHSNFAASVPRFVNL
jgi:hypothetical protein